MNKKPTGGYAFPNSNMEGFASGMSLRDYFAAAAVSGLCADPQFNPPSEASIAATAYRVADAMLAERKK